MQKSLPVYPHPSIMPTFQGLVNEEQLLQLIAYLKSIGPQQSNAGGRADRARRDETIARRAEPAPATGPQTGKPTPRP